MSSHQPIVTKSPFHWCAISCAMMEKPLCFEPSVASGRWMRMFSLYVMPPQFSIAPPKPPGIAMWSSLGSGNFTPK